MVARTSRISSTVGMVPEYRTRPLRLRANDGQAVQTYSGQVYSERLLARFFNPGYSGDVELPDGLGIEGNITCGDAIHISLKMEDGIIRLARFRTQGCATAIAAADATCELATGLSITAACTLGPSSLAALLGGVPEERANCAALALEALRTALKQVRSHSSG